MIPGFFFLAIAIGYYSGAQIDYTKNHPIFLVTGVQGRHIKRGFIEFNLPLSTAFLVHGDCDSVLQGTWLDSTVQILSILYLITRYDAGIYPSICVDDLNLDQDRALPS